ncbi:TPA: DUF2971 domain-containing protein [Vibrio parahaemolyticus]|nr:DUF2971 domain-containing protein [Vibrio parahaemolyticus]
MDNLKNKRLKVSNINNLNDPFEMLCVQLINKTTKCKLLNAKQMTAERYGILCFSRNWSNPVQWGHYADNHKGLCLVFEIPDSDLKKVDYVSKRIHPDSIDLENEAEVYRILTTKFEHWRYEQEHRSIYVLGALQKENELFFKGFGQDLKLKKVIIGSCSNVKKDKVQRLVSKGVEVFHAKLHDSKFTIERDKTK